MSDNTCKAEKEDRCCNEDVRNAPIHKDGVCDECHDYGLRACPVCGEVAYSEFGWPDKHGNWHCERCAPGPE